MCVSGCLEVVRDAVSRREFLGGALAAGVASSESTVAAAPNSAASFPAFQSVVDLTHTFSSQFFHYRGGRSTVELKAVASTTSGDDWNVTQWTIDEHAGTHIDSPFHRNSRGVTVERIPVGDLVLPLAVVDITERANHNPDAELTLEDLKLWERKNGRLPDGCCVAMNSGWDRHVKSEKFIGFDDRKVRHFPGFHVDAARFLFEDRNVKAIAVDTPSFDHGPTEGYPVHVLWLGANRYGLENVANLGGVPAVGATIVAGAPKIAGATGGHTRVLALV